MKHLKIFEDYNNSYEKFLNQIGLDYDILLDTIENEGDLIYTEPQEVLDNKLDYLIDLKKQKDIILYRVIFTKDKSEINIDNLGLCYVSDLEDFHDDMLNYLYHNAKKVNKKLKETDCYLITIKTDISNIDFKSTLDTFSEHPNENEITLYERHNSIILEIDNYYQ